MLDVRIVKLQDINNNKVIVYIVPEVFGKWIDSIKEKELLKENVNKEQTWTEDIPVDVLKEMEEFGFIFKYTKLVCGKDSFENDLYLSILDNAPKVFIGNDANYEIAEEIHNDVYNFVTSKKLNIINKYIGKFYPL